jgi:succinate dehydrogenase / fumarate reductase cytochrome b subunit
MPQRSKADRPLSPHLQVYRPQLTSVLSILHRISGVALSIGLIALAWFLLSLAAGPESYMAFAGFAGSLIGKLMIIGWTAALSFHLCSGIRHLFFDTGSLFDLRHAYMAGYAVLAGSVILFTIFVLAAQ